MSRARAPRARRLRFAIYASASGSYFLREIRHLLACGLRAAGAEARELDERGGFAARADWHVIVAPHEFFARGRGVRLRASSWPPGVILYNTAQPASAAFAFIGSLLPRAHAVWDMDLESSNRHARGGWRSAHVPPGWVAGCRLFPSAPIPYGSRTIDALCVGSRTPRRGRLLRAAARAGLGVAAVVAAAPPRSRRFHLGLARRAKIVLNIHRRDEPYFEWHRAVLHGLAQGALVISEPATASPPLRPGRDFVTAPLGEFPATIRRYLSSPRAAAAIAARGLRTYRRSCRLPAILGAAVKALARAEGAKARKARLRAEAALSLLNARRRKAPVTPRSLRPGRRRRKGPRA